MLRGRAASRNKAWHGMASEGKRRQAKTRHGKAKGKWKGKRVKGERKGGKGRKGEERRGKGRKGEKRGEKGEKGRKRERGKEGKGKGKQKAKSKKQEARSKKQEARSKEAKKQEAKKQKKKGKKAKKQKEEGRRKKEEGRRKKKKGKRKKRKRKKKRKKKRKRKQEKRKETKRKNIRKEVKRREEKREGDLGACRKFKVDLSRCWNTVETPSVRTPVPKGHRVRGIHFVFSLYSLSHLCCSQFIFSPSCADHFYCIARLVLVAQLDSRHSGRRLVVLVQANIFGAKVYHEKHINYFSSY